jgi:tRNA threonylcarbamoyladenosine biosynthesis protein TsaB
MFKDNLTPILAIECSSPLLSLAIQSSDQTFSHQQEGSRKHSQFILNEINNLLQQAGIHIKDIKTVVAGNGPGSFIGVRLAHAVAQALCLPDHKQLITLSSLQIIAQSAYSKSQAETILVAQDARKNEVYACAYQLKDRAMQAVTEEQLLAPDALQSLYQQLQSEHNAITLIGTGWQAYQEQLNIQQDIIHINDCNLAEGALQLASLLEHKGEQAEPNYVRNHVADLPKQR